MAKPSSAIVGVSPQAIAAAREAELFAPLSADITVSQRLIPTRKQLERALGNLERVENEVGRQVRRLKEKIRKGEKKGLNPLQSLLWKYTGNPSQKIADEVAKELSLHIEKRFRKYSSLSAAHADYRNRARKKHPEFEPVTKKTYGRWVERRPLEERAQEKGGKRARNAASPSTSVKDREIRATRAFERGCIDHTLLKLFVVVVSSNGKVFVRRPWLTALVDDYSDYWLSFFLSFQAPSRNSLAMIFRNCVREHGRVPEFVHSDRGADLRSRYYMSLLAHMQSTPDWNPAANSRFNGQVEQLNLQIKQQWLAHRPGNIIDYDNRRGYSKGYRPADYACLKLPDTFEEISAFKDIYNDSVIGVEQCAPAELFEQSLTSYDFSGIPVEFDEEFLIASSVETDASDYAISANGDIHRNDLHFTHPELRRVRPKKTRTELRPDPEDPYRVYCHTGDRWVTALSGRHNVFATGNAFERYGEAVRVAEGRPVRDFAKSLAAEVVAEKASQFDDMIDKRTKDQKVIKFPGQSSSPTQAKKSDVFRRLRESDISELESEDRE